MNRIDSKFQALREAGEKAFIAYVCAGDPDLKTTAALAAQFERIGVDILELGVPFSDPLADGIVNQMAAERALRSGTTTQGVLDMIAGLRQAGCEIPIVLYIYFNLIHRHGVGAFARAAALAGVDGVLALDLPPEEAAEYQQEMLAADLCPIYLIAPTTPAARVAEICRQAAGFIYYVSREGVTGMQQAVAANIAPMIDTIRRHTGLPVAIGFGVSSPAQARQVAAAADAVVVGSAIVNQIAQGKSPAAVARFVAPMVQAVRPQKPVPRKAVAR